MSPLGLLVTAFNFASLCFRAVALTVPLRFDHLVTTLMNKKDRNKAVRRNYTYENDRSGEKIDRRAQTKTYWVATQTLLLVHLNGTLSWIVRCHDWSLILRLQLNLIRHDLGSALVPRRRYLID
jgi:hypothetical protein